MARRGDPAAGPGHRGRRAADGPAGLRTGTGRPGAGRTGARLGGGPDRGADPPVTAGRHCPGPLATAHRRLPSPPPHGRAVPLPRPGDRPPDGPAAAAGAAARGAHRARRGAPRGSPTRAGCRPTPQPRPGGPPWSSVRRSSRPTRSPPTSASPRRWPSTTGSSERFFGATPLTEAALEARGIRSPFVLHAGGCTERKNLAGLAEAWPLVRSARPDAMLVLVGPQDERRDRLFAPLAGTVRLGRVDDATVPGLMAAAAGRRRPLHLRGVRTARPRGHGRRGAGGGRGPELAARGLRLTPPTWWSRTDAGLAEGLVAAAGRRPRHRIDDRAGPAPGRHVHLGGQRRRPRRGVAVLHTVR